VGRPPSSWTTQHHQYAPTRDGVHGATWQQQNGATRQHQYQPVPDGAAQQNIGGGRHQAAITTQHDGWTVQEDDIAVAQYGPTRSEGHGAQVPWGRHQTSSAMTQHGMGGQQHQHAVYQGAGPSSLLDMGQRGGTLIGQSSNTMAIDGRLSGEGIAYDPSRGGGRISCRGLSGRIGRGGGGRGGSGGGRSRSAVGGYTTAAPRSPPRFPLGGVPDPCEMCMAVRKVHHEENVIVLHTRNEECPNHDEYMKLFGCHNVPRGGAI